MTVAVLCCSKNSVYKSLPGTDCYDEQRNAFTWPGGCPVVAHPPCRLWSAFCAHQAKSKNPEAEKLLGLFCVKMVQQFGGVLEQPAYSRLWAAAKLPLPGGFEDGEFSIAVLQGMSGTRTQKRTWLFFSGLNRRDLPPMPFKLLLQGGEKRLWGTTHSGGRGAATPRPFAEWLLACASLSLSKSHNSDR